MERIIYNLKFKNVKHHRTGLHLHYTMRKRNMNFFKGVKGLEQQSTLKLKYDSFDSICQANKLKTCRKCCDQIRNPALFIKI